MRDPHARDHARGPHCMYLNLGSRVPCVRLTPHLAHVLGWLIRGRLGKQFVERRSSPDFFFGSGASLLITTQSLDIRTHISCSVVEDLRLD